MTNPSEIYKNRKPITEDEIEEMLTKANEIRNEYFRLRALALVGLLKKFGKRRRELSTLRMKDLQVKEGYLYVTFQIAKKHKKGLFQYLKELKKQNKPELLNKPYPELISEWRDWTKTELGHRFKNTETTKKVNVLDKYARLILEYYEYVKIAYPNAQFLFPSGKTVFGTTYTVAPNEHLSGRQLLRLIKPLNATIWLHLFRELKGKEIAEQLGSTLASVASVQDYLDLERQETALRYVRRFAIQEAKMEI